MSERFEFFRTSLGKLQMILRYSQAKFVTPVESVHTRRIVKTMHLQGVVVKIGDSLRFEGFLVEFELIFGKGMRTAASHFSESGGSLNRPDLFTELPFL